MFASLDDVGVQLEKLTRELDPLLLDGAGARRLLRAAVRIERLAGALKTLAVQRVESTGTWAESGHRSLASFVAAADGTSVGAAAKLAETAQQAAAVPAVQDALRAGLLSAAQVGEVAKAAAAAPDQADDLISAARHAGFKALRDEAARVIAAADRAGYDERYAKAVARRHVRFSHDDVTGRISIEAPLHTYAEIKTAIEDEARRVFREARADGRREPHEAYCVDALARLVATQPRPESNNTTTASARKPPRNVHLHLLVDLEALRRGAPADGETCEIPGVGPVPVSVARDYLTDAFLTVVIRKGKDIATIAHAGRYIAAELRTALALREPECIVVDCQNRGYLEYDHHHDHAKGGPTSNQNLGPMCRPHNVMKNQAFTLGPPDPRTGKRTLHPPRDPPPDTG